MKKMLTVIFVLLNCLLFGQDLPTRLKSINSVEQAEQFVEEHSDVEAQIITVVPSIESPEIKEEFSGRKLGDIFSTDNNTFKIVDVKKVKAFRVSHIFLDGNKLSGNRINNLRNKILRKYKSGIDFSTLANQYSMNHTPNGDLGWFPEGMMVGDFENAVKSHKKNDIFTIDVTDKKWFYIALKTFDDKDVEQLTILKVSAE